MFTVIHTTLDSFCAGTKTKPDRPSVHTRERWFRCQAAPRPSQKWRVTYRISVHTITHSVHVGTKSHPVWCEHNLSAQSIIRKWYFILMQIKLVFIRKFLHLASFWKWEFLEHGNGLYVTCTSPIMHLICPSSPPPQILHNSLFFFCAGYYSRPKRNWKESLCKISGGKQGALWEICKWRIHILQGRNRTEMKYQKTHLES